MKVIKAAVALAAALCLAACQTGEQRQEKADADLTARLAAYNGSTMADFMARTGMLPEDAYNVGNGRTFVFHGPTVVVTLPAYGMVPAVSRGFSCQLQIRTEHIGNGGGADSWKIIGTQRTGPCNNLPV